jgi:hypothetical protein
LLKNYNIYIKSIIRESLKNLSEAKNKKLEAGDKIYLPELTMNKKVLIKYLKDIYNIELKN